MCGSEGRLRRRPARVWTEVFVDPDVAHTPMNTAILKRSRKARNADERDRLWLVGNIQGGVATTAATE